MADRRTLSSSLSAEVIGYLRGQGHSQADVAKLLGVSEGFISLVKSRERSLTIDHLERVAESLSVPLGALLLAVTPPPPAVNKSKELAKLYELSERFITEGDKLRATIMRSTKHAAR